MNGQRLLPNVRCSRKTSQAKAGFWMYRGAEKMPRCLSAAASCDRAAGDDPRIDAQAVFPVRVTSPRSNRGRADAGQAVSSRPSARPPARSRRSTTSASFVELRHGDRALQLGHAVVQGEEIVVRLRIAIAPGLVDEQEHPPGVVRRRSVTTRPPSPVVMCLPCCRLKQPMSPIVPTGLPAWRAQNAWAQSSITAMPRGRQSRMIAGHVARVAEQVRDDDRPRPRADTRARSFPR